MGDEGLVGMGRGPVPPSACDRWKVGYLAGALRFADSKRISVAVLTLLCFAKQCHAEFLWAGEVDPKKSLSNSTTRYKYEKCVL